MADLARLKAARLHMLTASSLQFLSLNALGTAAFLRMRLRAHLNEIKADDIEISEEGIEDLTDDEFRQACRARHGGALRQGLHRLHAAPAPRVD